MKYLIFLALVALASAGQRPVWPRLPVGWKPPNDDSKIVGGEIVDITKHPYQIALLRYGSLSCGGSVLDNNNILTAAHCIRGVSPSVLTVRADSSYHATGGQTVKVSRIVQHENYSPWTYNNDVAVLHLATPLTGSVHKTVELASSGDFTGSMATVSGWGTTSSGGYISSQLRAVDVPVISNADCYSKYGGSITDGMLCAGYATGGKDSCQGDSGGPLVQTGTYLQIGVVSWGYGCADARYPGVYARVTEYLPWIQSNMQ